MRRLAKIARFLARVACIVPAALTFPLGAQPKPALIVEFPPLETGFGFKKVASWEEGEVQGQRGWFVAANGLPGVHRLDQNGGSYRGPAIHAGGSVFLTHGALGAILGEGTVRLFKRQTELRLDFEASAAGACQAQGAFVWFMEPARTPFDIFPDTRFAFRANPASAWVSDGSWKFAWLIADREGSLFVSSETFEHTATSSVQLSGSLATLRWARANFSSPNLFQRNLDFNGQQPSLTGLRGAGVYGHFESPEIDPARSPTPFFWVNLKRFVAGDTAAVTAALAAYSGETPSDHRAAPAAGPAPAPKVPSSAPAAQGSKGAEDATAGGPVPEGSSSGVGLNLGVAILLVGLGVLGLAIWGAAHINFGGPEGGSSGGRG